MGFVMNIGTYLKETFICFDNMASCFHLQLNNLVKSAHSSSASIHRRKTIGLCNKGMSLLWRDIPFILFMNRFEPIAKDSFLMITVNSFYLFSMLIMDDGRCSINMVFVPAIFKFKQVEQF